MRFAGCLFLGVFLFSFSALAKSGVDPADEIDQQMAFVDSAMRSIEKQRSEMDSEKKDEEIHRRALEKANRGEIGSSASGVIRNSFRFTGNAQF